MHAGKVLGLLTTVLVLDPPNLVCRDLFGSYNCGLKGFHFGDLQFYSIILSILSKNGPKLPEILKIYNPKTLPACKVECPLFLPFGNQN